MKKKESRIKDSIIEDLRYYNGERENPYTNPEDCYKALVWRFEQMYFNEMYYDITSSGKRPLRVLQEWMDDYRHYVSAYGNGNYPKDGIPFTVQSMVWGLYCYHNELADFSGFHDFYEDWKNRKL